MQEVLKKIRHIEIKIRKEITNKISGDYKSIFKGSGLEVSDIRAYQYGDEVRAIDWNVSAKGQGTFVKTFREEKEQNVFFIMDVSGSQELKSQSKSKIDIGKEVCAVLALSAAKSNSTVGLIGFSDIKEIFIKPDKGINHTYNLIYRLFNLNPKSPKTNLKACFQYAFTILKKRSIVVLISDFIDLEYQKQLIALARKHDLVVIHLSDQVEFKFPKLGIIPIVDKESKKTKWVNTSSKKFREHYLTLFNDRKSELKNICLQNGATYLWIDTQKDYIPQLISLFKNRK